MISSETLRAPDVGVADAYAKVLEFVSNTWAVLLDASVAPGIHGFDFVVNAVLVEVE